jgi:2-dehydropantoate 2-reductase
MKVGISGAGAMGSLFGGLLALDGHEVWFVDVWREHCEAIERDGLRMTFRGEERLARGRGSIDPADAGPVDLLMIWCKSFSTGEALEQAAPMIGERTIVCSLQNGLGNVERIEERVPADRIVYGVTGIGAATEGPGHIELTEGAWTGTSMTWIGGRTPAALAEARRLAEILESADVRMEVREDIDTLVWNKLAMASAMAALTAITRLHIGHIIDTDESVELCKEMTREIVAVANAKGIPLDADEAIERNFATYGRSRGHLPSMLQDVLAMRRTEIDALSGAVAREGELVGVATPVNRTIWQLIRTIEQRYDDQLLRRGDG